MRHLRILVLTLVPAVPAAAQPVPCTTGLAPGSTLAGELGAAPGGSFTELACLEIRSDQAFERREVAVSGVPLPAALRLTDARLLTLVGPGEVRIAAQFGVLSRWGVLAGTVIPRPHRQTRPATNADRPFDRAARTW